MRDKREAAQEFLLQYCRDEDYSKEVYSASGYARNSSINLSSIYTELIQNTGRFVERYASDLLIGIKDVDDKIRYGENAIVFFGMREDGVDHLSFVAGHLVNRTMHEYRRLYAIIVSVNEDNLIKVTLRKLDAASAEYKFNRYWEEHKV